ncbi:MAG: helix-turn-helix domain-containing protein [Dermatophilaceae bacterium]
MPTDRDLARSLGERLRFRRLAVGRTQPVIAGLAGITVDYLYQLERGKKVPALPVLIALAAALETPVSDLLGPREAPSAPVRADGGSALHRAMSSSITAPHVGDATQLRSAVEGAWRVWQSSPHRYSRVGKVLPDLVVAVEAWRCTAATSSERRAADRLAADLYGLTRSVAKRSGRLDLAAIAADRGWSAAESADDPLRMAAARWNQAHSALATGSPAMAEEIAMRTAAEVESCSGAAPAAVRGSLLLVASVAAARQGSVWTARDRVRSAGSAADTVGETNTLWTAFGPTSVAMHATGIEFDAGETSIAASIAATVRREQCPSIERRVAFLLEQARSQQRADNLDAALGLLDLAATEAPEDAQRRPVVREVLREVMTRGGRSVAVRAAGLATRIGVDPVT